MTWLSVLDALRLVVLGLSGTAIGVMLVVVWVAAGVLRPPVRLGFLWWHIIALTAGVAPLIIVAAEATLQRLAQPLSWRLPVLLTSLTVLNVGLVIVYRLEKQRLVDKRALERVRR